ncbi:hypothetical protein FZC66_20110 [Priestia megaterium]|nr:hypothetical protein FZC66_20110 [Priestia megaterium]
MNIIKNLQDDQNHFNDYCSAITSFCPFLQPAIQHGALFQQTILLPNTTQLEIEEEIFYNAVMQVERFRNQRKLTASREKKLLLCYNLIFIPPTSQDAINGEKYITWPHYLLKLLYTKVGIMFGKFWLGEEGISRDGRSIPSPTCTFISIRSVVKNRDPYFFEKTPELVNSLIESIDDGRNVHNELGLQRINFESLDSMRCSDYYSKVKRWGNEILHDSVLNK